MALNSQVHCSHATIEGFIHIRTGSQVAGSTLQGRKLNVSGLVTKLRTNQTAKICSGSGHLLVSESIHCYIRRQFTYITAIRQLHAFRYCNKSRLLRLAKTLHQCTEGIQIKHLLSHSSGVPDARGGIPRELKIKGDEKLAMSYLPELDFLHFKPGEAYEYINPTFVMCGAIVEKVTGQPCVEYVAEHIFRPAGMDKTLYFDPEHQELIPNMAHGYEYADVEDMPEERTADSSQSDEPKNWYEYDYGEETFFATRPDGGIYSSTHEFVEWEKALRANKVLTEASRVDAQSPHTFASDSPWSDYQNRPNTWYGYGWFIEPKTDTTKEVIYHTGDNGGFKILAARYPEDNALVLIFANRADWDRYEVMQQVEAIFGF